MAALAGLLLWLLGCNGTGLGGPIAQAATVSSKTAGYRVHMAVQVTSSALSTSISATGSGVVDLRDHASSMSLAMSLGDEPQMVQELGGSTLRIDMITDGAVVYTRLPAALTAGLPTFGRAWIKVDLAKLSSLPGLSSLAGNPTTSDPSQILQSLRSASGRLVDEGRQRVDGVQTTHYRAQLSLAQVADGLPSAQRSAAGQALSTLRQALSTAELPTDVWVDADHLVRRIQMTLGLGLPTGPSIRETVTVDLGHYGPQRPPPTPPPDQVLDLSSLPGVG